MSLRALLFRRPPDPQLIEIAFDGEIYPVQLRRHAQARRYTLRIQAATRTVLLTMPMRGSLREAKAFAERNGGWIAARLKRLPQAIAFADGLELPLRDVPHRITHRPGARGTVWIEAGDDMPLLCVAGDPAHLPRRVRDYLKREAKRELEAASRRYAAMLGVTVKRVAVRDQTSRWGSCTSAGRALLFVAADPRAAACARLSGGARGGASGRDEPLARVLARGRAHLSRVGARQGLAQRARHRAAPVWRGVAARKISLLDWRCVDITTETCSVLGRARPLRCEGGSLADDGNRRRNCYSLSIMVLIAFSASGAA